MVSDTFQVTKEITIQSCQKRSICFIWRLQCPDLDIIFPAARNPRARAWIWTLWPRKDCTIFIAMANEHATFAAEEFSPRTEKTPWILCFKVGPTFQLLDLGESALINGQKWDHSLLDGLAVLRTNIWCVSVWGAQIQRISTRSTAVSYISVHNTWLLFHQEAFFSYYWSSKYKLVPAQHTQISTPQNCYAKPKNREDTRQENTQRQIPNRRWAFQIPDMAWRGLI